MKPLRISLVIPALLVAATAALLTGGCGDPSESQPAPSGGDSEGSPAPDAGTGAEASGAPGTAAGKAKDTPPTAAPTAAEKTSTAPGKDFVVLETDRGEIIIELHDEDAPKHCENFRGLVRNGFYNGKGFHRVVDKVLVQAGATKGDGTGSEGDTIPAEIKLPHRRGAVGMARQVDAVNPNRQSLGSQFYICLADVPELDRLGYTVFGTVVKGVEVAATFPPGDPAQNDIVPPGNRVQIKKAEIRRIDPSSLRTSVTVTPPAASVGPPATAPASVDEYAVIETDVRVGDGKIVIDLFEASAPRHAEHFKELVRRGFYNGSEFHRVIDGFMAQGGGPPPGEQEPNQIAHEIKLPHLRGSVAAARTPNPEKKSSGCQFYICFGPQPHLDQAGYTVYGHVVKGMDVVDGITKGAAAANGAVPPDLRTKILRATLVPASTVRVETPSPAK